ncbi:MAG TPA: acyltransferase [Actinobacteria bacterium]|nr:acyltransferase [Actinomycetota bacterium]
MAKTDLPPSPGSDLPPGASAPWEQPGLTRAQRRIAARESRLPKDRPASRLREVDLLRFIAAAAVMLYHFTARLNPAWGPNITPVQQFPELSQYTRYGFLGVELFFLISGFVILMTAWGRRVGEFAIARFTRLFPAYVFAVFCTTAVVVNFSRIGNEPSLQQILTNMTLLQEPLGIPSVDGVYWSLLIELKFYFLMALVVAFGITYRRVVSFMGIWLVATVALQAAATQGQSVAFLEFFLFPRWSHYFIAGMALFLIYRFGSNIVLWSMVFVTWVITLSRVPAETAGAERVVGAPISEATLYAGITALFLIMALVAVGGLRWMRWRLLTALGLLTYPLYLLHEWIGWVAIDRLRSSFTPWTVLAIVCGGMILLAWFVAVAIEAPLAKRLRSSLNRALAQMRHEGPLPGR